MEGKEDKKEMQLIKLLREGDERERRALFPCWEGTPKFSLCGRRGRKGRKEKNLVV